jgi:hypothetical protein
MWNTTMTCGLEGVISLGMTFFHYINCDEKFFDRGFGRFLKAGSKFMNYENLGFDIIVVFTGVARLELWMIIYVHFI